MGPAPGPDDRRYDDETLHRLVSDDISRSELGVRYVASDVVVYLFSVACFLVVAVNWAIFGDIPYRNVINIFGVDLLELGLLITYSGGFALLSILRARDLRREFRRRVESERAAYHLAHSDQLTGLANRRRFLEAVDDVLATPLDAGRVHVILLLDLNGFKTINDGFGHSAGDEVLREIGQRLQGALQRDEGTVARLGGDEFAMVVHDVGETDVATLAQRILSVFDRPVRIYDVDFAIEGSLGAALATRDGATASSDLIRRADLALYRSKANALPRSFTVFTPALESRFWSNVSLCADFEAALEDGAFEPSFLPIMDVERGHVEAFAVVAHWHHARLGSIGPDVYLPVASVLGKRLDLTERILEKAADWAVSWPEDIGLALNVSAQELTDPAFSRRIAAVLERSGFPPRRLELEIAGTSELREIESAGSSLDALSEFGVRFALSGFASETSALPLLGSAPFSRMKIDRSVVQGDAADRFARAVLATAVELGRALDIRVTAESVETQEQLRRLKELGCTSCEGPLFSPPLRGDQTGAFLAANTLLV